MIAVVRPLLLLVLDVLECLGRIMQPAFWSALALGLAVALGQVLVAMQRPAFGGYVIGALAVVIVLALLWWADHRHGWWSR